MFNTFIYPAPLLHPKGQFSIPITDTCATACIFSVETNILAVGCSDGMTYVQSLGQAERIARLRNERYNGIPVADYSFSPDGKTLATAYKTGDCTTFNLERKVCKTWRSESHADTVVGVTYTSCGSFLILAYANRGLEICDEQGFVYPIPLFQNDRSFNRPFKKIHYLPLHDVMVSLHNDDQVHLWKVNFSDDHSHIVDMKNRRRITSHSNPTGAIDSNKSGTALAIGFENHVVQVLVFGDQGSLQTHDLIGHTNKINVCAFSPNEQWLVSGSEDGTLRIWDTYNWDTSAVFVGHESPITAVVFLSDVEVLSIAKDGKAFFWDVSSLRPLRQIQQFHFQTPISAPFQTPISAPL